MKKEAADHELLGRLEHLSKIVEEVGPEILGQRVRRMRESQGFSIREVAERAGISKNSVVRLEQGRGTQVTTILKICSALDFHVERLAASTSPDAVAALHKHKDDQWFDLRDMGSKPLLNAERPMTQAQRKKAVKLGGQVPINLLKCRLPNGNLLPSILEIYQTSPPRSHVGEEFIYILSGNAIITIGNKKHRLKEGESMTFWSSEPHTYSPADPKKVPVRLLSVRCDG